ncbi:dynein light chain Tctex-type 5-like [Heptranchias perlo]|uniref:dynein light chain Tctex-type 5-like n=1 Tax=Heptranchias perlo TaxID=212740 RepID=UPI00355A678D
MDRRRLSLAPDRGTEKRMSISNKGRTNSIPFTSKATSELGAVRGRASLGNLLSEAHPSTFSFKGLLVARRLTKNLKERTALKIAAKKPAVTKIINEQVLPFSSKPPEKFCTFPVQKFLEEYVPDKLKSVSYSPALAGRLAKEMSEEIKEFAKGALPPRYKLVCVVTVGERSNEDVLLTSRALWDSYADTFASHGYENSTVFCAASIFAVYCE